jgi:O-methyltransferase involved in polyketide biosynthesis
VIELRRRLLPSAPRQDLIASSVGDGAWLDALDRGAGVMVTAQGLLMYLEPGQVHELIDACASRITDGALLFDAVPRWLSERTQRRPLGGPTGYRPPPWTWGIDAAEVRRIRATANIAELRRLRLPRGRGGLFGYALPLLGRVPGVGDRFFSIMLARLGATL